MLKRQENNFVKAINKLAATLKNVVVVILISFDLRKKFEEIVTDFSISLSLLFSVIAIYKMQNEQINITRWVKTNMMSIFL